MSDLTWQKSSYSGQGDGASCVELASTGDTISLRESDDPGTALTAAPAGLQSLLLAVKNGQFDGRTVG
ncbi:MULTISPECIES: DUF397 domain-containing protein [unclassified Streptomyces]|uniref:DUF397 domain-containing protein n=1 Tax=unclassified Streptomyces TaxID=2593676 RepID=UPI000BF7081C|nr:DUF397 domain-containing protein [Streptomyces sp. Ru87]PGH48661.1 DUF397 domain-containing protein [Streptomyces sp. Ru87]